MPFNIAVAVIVNLTLLLLLSWVFFILILTKYRSRLAKRKKSSNKESKNTSETETIEALKENNQQQKKSVDRINRFIDEFDSDDERIVELQSEVDYLESQLEHSLTLINQHAESNSTQEALGDSDPNFTINALKFKNNSLRNENDQLHEKIEKVTRYNTRLKHYRDEHRLLTAKVTEFTEQTKKSDHLIKKLQSKLIATQTAAEEAQRALQRLQIPKADDKDDELKDALDRAEREKQFLEQQYLELLQQLEEAELVSEQLQRSQAECAQLEQAYMALVEEINEAEKQHAQEDTEQAETEDSIPLGAGLTSADLARAEQELKASQLSNEEIREKTEQ